MTAPVSDNGQRPLELWDLAAVLGGLRWVESALFRRAGGWIPTTPEPQVRVMWSVQSFHHAWHADVLRDRLPELRGLDPELVTVPPSSDWVTAFDALDTLDSTADRLSMWFGGIIPALVGSYESMAARVDDVGAPGVHRWIRHVLLDEYDDLATGLEVAAAHPSDIVPSSALPAGFIPTL